MPLYFSHGALQLRVSTRRDRALSPLNQHFLSQPVPPRSILVPLSKIPVSGASSKGPRPPIRFPHLGQLLLLCPVCSQQGLLRPMSPSSTLFHITHSQFLVEQFCIIFPFCLFFCFVSLGSDHRAQASSFPLDNRLFQCSQGIGTFGGHSPELHGGDCGGLPQVVPSEAVVHLECPSCPSKDGLLDLGASLVTLAPSEASPPLCLAQVSVASV